MECRAQSYRPCPQRYWQAGHAPSGCPGAGLGHCLQDVLEQNAQALGTEAEDVTSNHWLHEGQGCTDGLCGQEEQGSVDSRWSPTPLQRVRGLDVEGGLLSGQSS